MPRTILKYLLVLGLCISLPAQALPDDKWAHIGLSFAATTVSYGICKKLFRMKDRDPRRWRCVLAAGLMVGTAGVIKEATDPFGDRDDVFANAVGIGVAGISIAVFEF